jgi:MOSC domain-containing protein YiiM
MPGRLLGIARKSRPRGTVETVVHTHVGLATGVAGDFRGSIAPGKSNRRQVTVFSIDDWEAATSGLGIALPWTERRANLLIDGIDLPQREGVRLRIGGHCALEITGETRPCRRMDDAVQGLFAALIPDWRGGVTAKVIAEGDIALGDPVSIEE